MPLKTTDSDEAFIEAARDQYGSDGEIEIDDNAIISRGDDPGHYVQAWVWVSAAYPSDEELEAMEAAEEEAEALLRHKREAVLDDWIDSARSDRDFLVSILRDRLNEMSDEDIIQAYSDAGLDEQED